MYKGALLVRLWWLEVLVGVNLDPGVVYTLPALVLLGYWDDFDYWETTMITLIGGTLGVCSCLWVTLPGAFLCLFEACDGCGGRTSVSRGRSNGRSAEGDDGCIAQEGKAGLHPFGDGGGGVLQAGTGWFSVSRKEFLTFSFWSESIEGAWFASGFVFYIGCNLSPALVGVGYIMKLRIAMLTVIGGVLNWWIFIPIISSMGGKTSHDEKPTLEEKNEGESSLQYADRLWDRYPVLVRLRATKAGSIHRGGGNALGRTGSSCQPCEATVEGSQVSHSGVFHYTSSRYSVSVPLLTLRNGRNHEDGEGYPFAIYFGWCRFAVDPDLPHLFHHHEQLLHWLVHDDLHDRRRISFLGCWYERSIGSA